MNDLKLKYIKKRGTLYFPIDYYHLDEKSPQYIMMPHWHDEFEIIRVCKGYLTFSIQHEIFHAHEHDVVIVNSGFLHSGEPFGCEYESIVFDFSIFGGKIRKIKFIELLEDHAIFLNYYYSEQDHKIFYSIIEQLFVTIREKKDGFELSVLGDILRMLGYLEKQKCFYTIGRYDVEKYKKITIMKQVLTFIEEHYMEPITLEQLSFVAEMSSTYFCHFFFTMTEKTPIEYIINYRVEKACDLLSNTRKSISEVAFQSGFHDVSHFIKTFKKQKGVTPKHYQVMIKNSKS